MKLRALFYCSLLVPVGSLVSACSSDDSSIPAPVPDASPDATTNVSDAAPKADAAPEADATTKTDASPETDAAPEADAKADVETDAHASDGGPDAADSGEPGDASCSGAWTAVPTVNAAIAVPADAGDVVLLHAFGTGSQNYACQQASDGGFGWVFVGPQADLLDCNGQTIGHHFASDGGPSKPEWMLTDNSYVIASKVAAFDGGSASIPWLLLQATANSDAGTLATANYIQRLNTDGGLMPTTACDVDSGVQMVPYTADYYFYQP
jgi:hypothetical protein